jgi:hypothetical protein
MKKVKQLFKIMTLLLLSVLVFTSCDDDDDKKGATMDVSFKMKTTSTTTTKSMTPNSLVFNSGSVTIREIVFDGEKSDTTMSVSITHEQIATIDLVTGVATPAVEVEIPVGAYTDVNLGIEIYDEVDDPSVIAEGIYTNADGTEIPVRFEFNSGEVFEADAEAHTFKDGSSAIAEIDFSPAVWFSTITGTQLDNAEQVAGVIIVSESYNSGIFDIVADKLDDATQATFK